MLQKLGHFGKHIRITLKEFKRGAGEGWRSFELIYEKWSIIQSEGGKEQPK